MFLCMKLIWEGLGFGEGTPVGEWNRYIQSAVHSVILQNLSAALLSFLSDAPSVFLYT